jgi:uncharacterized caspase-like protein
LRFPHGLLVTLILLAFSLPAPAEKRVALIIGNGDYADPSLKLDNPVNDARAMERALKAAGFTTIVLLNAKRIDFYRAVARLREEIHGDPNAVGLFYYAGHGIQADGMNYLIPIDARIETDADLEANAYDAAKVLHALQEADNGTNIVILDACRDNPLPKGRGVERGLARMDAPGGTFIAYAAAPGHVAHDGLKGTNGVFTGELIKAMVRPGEPLEQVFKVVIRGVAAATNGSQHPWTEASLPGDFFFYPAPATVASKPDPEQATYDAAFWQQIRNSKTASDYATYLQLFPHGGFAEEANSRLKGLGSPRAANPKPEAPVALDARPKEARPLKISDAARQPRCDSILARIQLGETLDEDERGYFREKCH